jgi:transposase
MPDIESLQQENAALRRLLAERDAELAELAVFEARLKAVLLEIENMKMQLAVLRRQRYGRSSEKLDSEIAQLELKLEPAYQPIGPLRVDVPAGEPGGTGGSAG